MIIQQTSTLSGTPQTIITSNSNIQNQPNFCCKNIDFMQTGTVKIGKTDDNKGNFIPTFGFILLKECDAVPDTQAVFVFEGASNENGLFVYEPNQINPFAIPFTELFKAYLPDADINVEITQAASGLGLTSYTGDLYVFGFYEKDVM